MRKIDTSAASGVKGLPLRSTSFNFMQEGYREAIGMALNVLFDNAYTGIPNFKGRVLQGLTQAGNIIANGYVAYVRNGYWEVCFVTGADITGYVGVPTMVADDIYDSVLDPTTMSDATTANVHSIRRYKIQDSNVGAGLVNYSDFVFFEDVFNEWLTLYSPAPAFLTTVINIGDWNMDTTASVNVAHGLTLSKIRTINVLIRDDSAAGFYPIEIADLTTGLADGNCQANATNIVLARRTGGLFDSASYDSTSYNRGFITIYHEA